MMDKYDQKLQEKVSHFENHLNEHLIEKQKNARLIESLIGQGKQIFQRLSNESNINVDSFAQLRNALCKIEHEKLEWEKKWDDRYKFLCSKLETEQVLSEKDRILNDLDLLIKEIELRKNLIETSNSFKNTTKIEDLVHNSSICWENISNWQTIINTLINKWSLEKVDEAQIHRLNSSLAEIEQKWKALNSLLNQFKEVYAKVAKIRVLYDEIEARTNEKIHHLNRLLIRKSELKDEMLEIDHFLNELNQLRDDVVQFNETKVKHLTELTVNIDKSQQIKYVTTKTIELLDNIMKLKTDTETLRSNLVNNNTKFKSQIYDDRNFSEMLYEPPDFKKRLESAIAFAGDKHLFECIVQGTRPISVNWTRNGQVIEEEENETKKYEIFRDDKTGFCSLAVFNSEQEDNGQYSCRITNKLGTAETSAYLKVKGKTDFHYLPPTYKLVFRVYSCKNLKLKPKFIYKQ
jgi:hypothetical protein